LGKTGKSCRERQDRDQNSQGFHGRQS
jgi:hypothetical protein